ncbi:SDR family oxidoreductase [Arthrobacter sp. CAU 1506]|nr:SDR family oxidoreductase [Arthrobacter sp. CAU 1506]
MPAKEAADVETGLLGPRLQGKSAIVTGASTLIGTAVCERLVAEGAAVTLADVDESGADAADRLGAAALFVSTDVTDERAVQECVDRAVRHGGGVNVLVNIASTYIDGGLAAKKEDWLTSYSVNVVGGVLMLAAVVPHMRERGGGAVVNFSSVSAERAQRGRWLYSATKAAVRQVTRSAAMDLAPDGIRVNSVSPGWIWSRPIAARAAQDRGVANTVAAPLTLSRRIGSPEEVAAAVAFLCSDDAAYINGTDLAIDGGYLAMGPERADEPWSLTELETDDKGDQ